MKETILLRDTQEIRAACVICNARRKFFVRQDEVR